MRALLLIAVVASPVHADPCTVDDPGIEASSPPRDTFTLTKAAFKDLPGWSDDKLAEAIPSFLKSCTKLAELKDDDPVGVDGQGGRDRQAHRVRRAVDARVADQARRVHDPSARPTERSRDGRPRQLRPRRPRPSP